MTKDEIKEIRRRHVDGIFKPEHFDEAADFDTFKSAAHFAAMQIAVELVSKAYEEAAQVVEGYQGACATPRNLAQCVRALADSIGREGER